MIPRIFPRVQLRVALAFALATCSLQAVAANPLNLIGETFSDWKTRLFGKGDQVAAVIDAPAQGPIQMKPDHPQRLRIDASVPEREFAKGKSTYRLIELPEALPHASVRIQVVAQNNPDGRGNVVYKPLLYVLDDGDVARDPVEAKPLHIDIRPFRRTRLLGCVTLDNVQRFAVATARDMIGKSYESEVRDAVKAPTKGGFHYSTDAVKVRLPYADSGVLILRVTEQKESGKGC